MSPRKLGCLALLCLLLSLIPRGAARSDFGGFSGNSDYGGGSSGSNGGYSTGDGSSGGMDFSPLFAAAALSGSDDWLLPVFILIIVGIIAMNQRSQRSKSRMRQSPMSVPAAPGRMLAPVHDYLRLDPGFDEARLCSHLANLYVQLQDAWHEKDIQSLRPAMTDAFYNQMERQLDALRKAHQTDCTERVAVLATNLLGYYQAGGMDYLVARLRARIVSYILDDQTGRLVSGDRKREKFMEYEWELVRKSGVTTEKGKEVQAMHCPHCGAPMNINASGQCPYCGSAVVALNGDWAISSMKGISQQTA